MSEMISVFTEKELREIITDVMKDILLKENAQPVHQDEIISRYEVAELLNISLT